MKIATDEMKVMARYVQDLSGISLDESKAYLMESRLAPLIEELGCRNYGELYFRAKNDPTRVIPNRILDAITTNETFFFRDGSPFELLRNKLIPDHLDQNQGQHSLSVWSAASSTGQEVYSIAMVLKETIPNLSSWRLRLLGTDISDAAIAQASYGKYNKVESGRGLTPAQVQKYFDADGEHWRIKDEIRAMASFQKLNLLEPLAGIGKFDIVFCRNVAIYFNPETRVKLFEHIATQMNPNGALIIGSTESLLGVTNRFVRREYHNSVFYQLTP